MYLVAVYGTLKRHYGNHRLVERSGGTFLGYGKTKNKFTMHNGGFPMVVPGNTSQINVEVYGVQDLGLLDQLEGHPTFFKRIPTDIEGFDAPAWMYVYQGEPSSPILEDGTWG